MTIHFNVHMDPTKGTITSADLREVIGQEIQLAANSTDSVLGELGIDAESLDIQGKKSEIS